LEDQERKILVRPRGLKAIFAHGERIVSKSVYVVRARMPNGRSFWVANTHFVSNYCETSNFESCSSYQNVRYSQLTQASIFLRERTGDEAVIFGGDLNFGPHPTSNDRSWKEFEKFFPGFLQATYHDNPSCTSCSSNSFKANHTDGGKIDHIYVSPNLTARDGALVFTDMMTTRQGLETHISDHYGWETTVDIP
jgi:endonuclease/exonuclease/phosphatase family metal-dependent hydrolase